MTALRVEMAFYALVVVWSTVLVGRGDCLKCSVCKPDRDPDVEETNNLVKDGGYEPASDGNMDKTDYEKWPICSEVNDPQGGGTMPLECPTDGDYVCGFAYDAVDQFATRACVLRKTNFLMGRCIQKDVLNDMGQVDCTFQLHYCNSKDLCNDEGPAHDALCNPDTAAGAAVNPGLLLTAGTAAVLLLQPAVLNYPAAV